MLVPDNKLLDATCLRIFAIEPLNLRENLLVNLRVSLQDLQHLMQDKVIFRSLDPHRGVMNRRAVIEMKSGATMPPVSVMIVVRNRVAMTRGQRVTTPHLAGVSRQLIFEAATLGGRTATEEVAGQTLATRNVMLVVLAALAEAGVVEGLEDRAVRVVRVGMPAHRVPAADAPRWTETTHLSANCLEKPAAKVPSRMRVLILNATMISPWT